MTEAITAGQDLPLVVTVRNSGEHAEARLIVPARSFVRFDKGLSQ